MSDSDKDADKNPSLTTKYSLLDQVRDPKNEEAWKEFIEYYKHYIYNILRKMGLNPNEATEMRQDIIVKLWKGLPEFIYKKDRGKFRFWLATVIKNDVRKLYRSRKRDSDYVKSKQEEEKEDFFKRCETSDIDKIIADEWDSYILNIAWNKIKIRFNEKTQEVFLLFADGKDRVEIAETCGIKKASVDVYIKRIRDQLKDEIEALNEELL